MAGGENVYEFRDGNVYLVSPGDESERIHVFENETRFLGLDASGTDIFFKSLDQLVPQDVDTQASFYDARAGGGFAAPAQQQACSGEACHGPVSAPPILPSTPASATTPGEAVAPPPQGPASAKRETPSRATLLARALRACGKKPKAKRAACERQARARYGTRKSKGGR